MTADVDRGAEVRREIQRDRRRQWLQLGLRLVVPLALAGGFVGLVVEEVRSQNRWREVSFHPRQTEVDPPTMLLEGGGCDLELRTTVTETAEVVFILLEERGTNDDGCGNGTQIALVEPIGERDVIDEATGQRWGRGIDPEKPRKWIEVDVEG